MRLLTCHWLGFNFWSWVSGLAKSAVVERLRSFGRSRLALIFGFRFHLLGAKATAKPAVVHDTWLVSFGFFSCLRLRAHDCGGSLEGLVFLGKNYYWFFITFNCRVLRSRFNLSVALVFAIRPWLLFRLFHFVFALVCAHLFGAATGPRFGVADLDWWPETILMVAQDASDELGRHH